MELNLSEELFKKWTDEYLRVHPDEIVKSLIDIYYKLKDSKDRCVIIVPIMMMTDSSLKDAILQITDVLLRGGRVVIDDVLGNKLDS